MAQLANVKYTSILPDGKTGNYTEGQRVTFQLPPRYAYIDGKQSYIKVQVDNTSVRSDTGVAPACPYPVVFPRHIGANVLFERAQFRDQTKGLVLEDIEAYNTYVGACKSYGYEKNEYPAQDLVERVGGHTNLPITRTADKPSLYYMQTQPTNTSNAGGVGFLTGGDTALTGEACVPLYLGLWSNLGGGSDPEHSVLPNLDIGGTQLDLYLEKAAPSLSLISHGFKTEAPGGFAQAHFINLIDKVACDAIVAPTDQHLDIESAIADLTVCSLDSCAFRVGMPVIVEKQDGTQLVVSTITSVGVAGTGSNQIRVSIADALGDTDSKPTIRIVPPTLSYNIRSIELRILETQPSNPAVIRNSLMQGINFKTTMLTKISQPAGLLNQVVDVPAVTERAMSIWAFPCRQDTLDGTIRESGSRIYPQINQRTSFVWAIRNVLIPNREIVVDQIVNSAADNTLYYKNVEMAMRPVSEVQAFMDSDSPDQGELTFPFFYPLLLAPLGSSYSLLGNEVQLRIKNTNSGTVPAYLYHVFVNHTRTLQIGTGDNTLML